MEGQQQGSSPAKGQGIDGSHMPAPKLQAEASKEGLRKRDGGVAAEAQEEVAGEKSRGTGGPGGNWGAGRGAAQAAGKEAPEAWYRWQQHSIPCFIRPPSVSAEAGQGSTAGWGQGASTPLPAAAAAAAATGGGTQGQGSRGGGEEDVSSSRTAAQAGNGSSTGVQALHLAVTTCAVQPDLILQSNLRWIEVGAQGSIAHNGGH